LQNNYKNNLLMKHIKIICLLEYLTSSQSAKNNLIAIVGWNLCLKLYSVVSRSHNH
jgi:hypothetical protein